MTDQQDKMPCVCPGCSARLRLPTEAEGRRVRCPRCKEVMVATRHVARRSPATSPPPEPAAGGSSNRNLWIIVGGAVLVLAIGGWWLANPGEDEPTENVEQAKQVADSDRDEATPPPTEEPDVVEPPAPPPAPKTPVELLLEVATPEQRSRITELQAALKETRQPTTRERDHWEALVRVGRLHDPLAEWWTEWLDAESIMTRRLVVRLIPSFERDRQLPMLDAAAAQPALMGLAAEITVQLDAHERAVRELDHDNPLRRYNMAAAARKWKSPDEAVLAALTKRVVSATEEPCVGFQSVHSLGLLARSNDSARTDAQDALLECLKGLAEAYESQPSRGSFAFALFDSAARELFDSGLRNREALDQILELFLSEDRFQSRSLDSLRKTLARFVEDRPEARAVWKSLVQNGLATAPGHKPKGSEVIAEFGCDSEHWDAISTLANRRGSNTYARRSLGLSLPECRDRLFSLVESIELKTSHHAPRIWVWQERYRRHPDYAAREFPRLFEIADDDAATKEARWAALQAVMAMGRGALSKVSRVEQEIDSRQLSTSTVIAEILRHDRKKLLSRFKSELERGEKRGPAHNLSIFVFADPVTQTSDLEILSPSIARASKWDSPVLAWAACGANHFTDDANPTHWIIQVLAQAPLDVAEELAAGLNDETRKFLGDFVRRPVNFRTLPPARIPALFDWLPSDVPVTWNDEMARSLTKLTEVAKRVDPSQPNPSQRLRTLLAEDDVFQVAVLNAITVESGEVVRDLAKVVRPVDPELLPLLPAFERRLHVLKQMPHLDSQRHAILALVSTLTAAWNYRDR